MFFTISQVRYKIKLRRSTAWSSWIRYIITQFSWICATRSQRKLHIRDILHRFFIFLRSPKNLKKKPETSESTHRSWRSVSSGQSSVKGEEIWLAPCRGSLQNENKADFQIYFWPRGIHYSTSHVNGRIKISVHWKWPLFANQMTWHL